MTAAKKKFEVDMLNGPIMPRLVSFALPLALSGILQLLFSAVDLIVVGRFGPEGSLAAVGATTFLLNLATGFFIGMSAGASVVAARFFATNKERELSETTHTAICMALITGVIMLLAGQLLARWALTVTNTPDDVIDMSVSYIRIYCLGMIFFMVYNYGAAILRAVGDTKRPLIFLAIAGTANIGFNLFFVIVCKLGVAGVAIGTVISQCISCTLTVICLCRANGAYKLKVSRLKINPFLLKQILKIGFPAGLQGAIIDFSNVLLQSTVNSLGSVAMSGYTAANNLFGFLYFTANSVSVTCMNFVSQNFAVKKLKRVKKTVLDCFILSFCACMILGSVFFFFGRSILGIYTGSSEVIACGVEILKYTTLTYFLCGFMDMLPSALRGLGHSAIPMVLSIIGTVGTRLVWIYLIFPMNKSLSFLFLVYPASWICTLIMQLACFFIVWRKVKRNAAPGELIR